MDVAKDVFEKTVTLGEVDGLCEGYLNSLRMLEE